LEAEWVWRPVIGSPIAGAYRASREENLLLFEREIADQLDDLEKTLLSTVRRTKSVVTLEVVAQHREGLKLTCGSVRWREYNHRRHRTETIYLDVPDRCASPSTISLRGPVLLPEKAAMAPSLQGRREDHATVLVHSAPHPSGSRGQVWSEWLRSPTKTTTRF
jgi:hypothetical protein